MSIEQKFEIEAKKQGLTLTKAKRIAGVIAFTAVSSMPAFADGFEASTIVTIITGFVAGVSAIGLAVLSLTVTAKVFKWVRTAI